MFYFCINWFAPLQSPQHKRNGQGDAMKRDNVILRLVGPKGGVKECHLGKGSVGFERIKAAVSELEGV